MSCIGKHGALSLEVTCDSTLKYGRHVLNRVERTGYSRATTIVYTHEYPLTLAKVETGQMSRLNARCLPIVANIRCIVLQRESLFRCYLYIYIYIFFSVRLLSVLRGHSGFFILATTANDLRLRRIFYPRFNPLHLCSYLNSWERDSIFPFECSVLNKGTTGSIFITSLVWRGPWLGIEPGTSRTRSQHYTIRLSRRR